MSSSDFLDRMRKAGEKYSGGGGTGVVGRILIEFGLHRYVTGHNFWSFWKAVPDDKDMDTVADELKSRLQAAGSTDSPSFGVKITIKADVLSRADPYKADLVEFIPAWQQDSFDLVYDTIANGDFPIGEIFYGRVQYKANPYFVKKGDTGKTETDQNGLPRYPSIRLPVEKFADKATAQATVGGSGGSNVDNSIWSEKARAEYPDISVLVGFTEEILHWYNKAKEGIPYNNDADTYGEVPKSPPAQKKYIADIYTCAPADIDIMISQSIAF